MFNIKRDFILRLVMTMSIGITSYTGDRILEHAKSPVVRAIFDNMTHAVVGGLTWGLIVLLSRKSVIQNLSSVILCFLISSAIDLDHFISARSWRLNNFGYCLSAAFIALTYSVNLPVTFVLLLTWSILFRPEGGGSTLYVEFWLLFISSFDSANLFRYITRDICFAINLEHFISARRWRLNDATRLEKRPFLHCTTIPITIWLLLTLSAEVFDYPSLGYYAWIILSSFISHHVRDATRRGLWFCPIGSTQVIPYYLYISIAMSLPYIIYWCMPSYGIEVDDYSTFVDEI